MKLESKVAVVTGGGRGIGRAIAITLAEEGASVVVAARTESEIQNTAQEIKAMGRRALAIRTDVTSEFDVNQMVQRILEEFGRINILVNNAGGNEGIAGIPLKDIKLQDWQKIVDVNLTSTFLCSKAVLPTMMSQKEGIIVNISSGMGIMGRAYFGPYCAAKFAVEGLTQALAAETNDHNIRVNCLRPGHTITRITENAPPEQKVSMRRPEDVKEIILFLATDASKGMTGESIGFGPPRYQVI